MKTVWYRQLGYYNNPFSIKPAAFHDEVTGYEEVVREIEKGIITNKCMFLEGKIGEGKTTILRRLLRDFGGQKKVVYFSCNRIEGRLKVRKLLNDRYGVLGRWFDIKPKNMILLLDEVQELELKDAEKVLKYYQEGFFRTVLFVGVKYHQEKFPAELTKNMKVLKLNKLAADDAVKIVRKRVGNLPLLSDEILRGIFARSQFNVRSMLKNCELVCKSAVIYGSSKVTSEMLDEVLGKESKPSEKTENWTDIELIDVAEETKVHDDFDDVEVAEIEEPMQKQDALDEVEKEIRELKEAQVEAKKIAPAVKREHVIDEDYY